MRYAPAFAGGIGSGLLQGRRVCTLADGWGKTQTIYAGLMAPDQLHSFMLAPYTDIQVIHDDACFSTFPKKMIMTT